MLSSYGIRFKKTKDPNHISAVMIIYLERSGLVLYYWGYNFVANIGSGRLVGFAGSGVTSGVGMAYWKMQGIEDPSFCPFLSIWQKDSVVANFSNSAMQ